MTAHSASLGRRHDGAQAMRALQLATARFQRVSADLICGLPEQNGRRVAG